MYGWELLMRIPFRACAIKFCEAVPPGKGLPCPFASDRKGFNIPLILNLLPISDFGWGWKKMPLNGEEGRLGAHSRNKWWVKWLPCLLLLVIPTMQVQGMAVAKVTLPNAWSFANFALVSLAKMSPFFVVQYFIFNLYTCTTFGNKGQVEFLSLMIAFT